MATIRFLVVCTVRSFNLVDKYAMPVCGNQWSLHPFNQQTRACVFGGNLFCVCALSLYIYIYTGSCVETRAINNYSTGTCIRGGTNNGTHPNAVCASPRGYKKYPGPSGESMETGIVVSNGFAKAFLRGYIVGMLLCIYVL